MFCASVNHDPYDYLISIIHSLTCFFLLAGFLGKNDVKFVMDSAAVATCHQLTAIWLLQHILNFVIGFFYDENGKH